MKGRLCPHYKDCINNSHCLSCEDFSLLKLPYKEPKEKIGKRRGTKTEKKAVKKANKYIKKAIEKSYQQNMQKLTPNSGALSIKGDSISQDLMLEMKERNKTLKGGNKSISIQKSWLEKLEKESAGKYYALPFTFGENEDKIYAVISYDVLLQMYYDIVYLKELVKKLHDGSGD